VVEVPFRWEEANFLLLDTAGVRRRTKVEYGVEFYSVGRTLRAIEQAEVCCLVIDASEGISRQEKRLGGLIERRGKGCVLVINKMDLSPFSHEEWKRIVRKELFFLDYAPIVFTVATRREGVEDLLGAVLEVYGQMVKKISTSFLMRSIERIMRERPLTYRGKPVKVFYAFQKSVLPPVFVIITSRVEAWKPGYRRFFVKRLRELLNLRNSPIRLVIEER